MQIISIDFLQYNLTDDYGTKASICYEDASFAKAELFTDEQYIIQSSAIGLWIMTKREGAEEKIISTLRTMHGGIMSIDIAQTHKKYELKRSQNHKLRYSLVNRSGDELLSLLPAINWQQKAPHFTLQVNEEYEKECSGFLILQALHCSLCSLSMMLGGEVPALVSI